MELIHCRVHLWLREFQSTEGPTLLLLHELGSSGADWKQEVEAWPGAVHALDFAGHGRSAPIAGGSYYPELLAGDANAALAAVGPAFVAGAGIGAYAALLLAGARPESVPAALLMPGAGLDGGGALPSFDAEIEVPAPPAPTPAPAPGLKEAEGTDPTVHRWLDGDIRPVDYAEAFGRAARRLILVEEGDARPPWWQALRSLPRVGSSPDPVSGLVALAKETRAP
jgi:pimeloyl-ACP methyl ester carboxylesterase